MTLILIYLLTIISYSLIGLFTLSTVTFIILSYLGCVIMLSDLIYHLFWLSLLTYSIFTLIVVVGKLKILFTAILNKEEGAQRRGEFISDIKYQTRYEIDWLKSNVITQLLTQILIFVKNVVNILFKWTFRR